jgi:glycosyltransferase involved in cell wall biosynthesis
MLIGIDASRATPTQRTGTESYSVRLIEALIRLEHEHQLRLYSRGEFTGWIVSGQGRAQTGSVERRVIPFPRLWTHLRLSWELLHHPPDVVFVPSHVLPLWTPVPSAVTIHDLGYLHFPSAHPLRQRWYLDWSTRHSTRMADVVFADSEATKTDLVTQYGIPATKVVVAYPGIDDGLGPVSDRDQIQDVKRRYGIEGDYVLHIGTLQPRKNLSRLVKAFADVPTGKRLELVLAGKRGWLYQHLFETVRRMGLEDRVRFVGYVPEEDKAALLSGARLYVFPSLYEGFGFPALEAQACETPLICSTSSSLPEVAGEGAIFVDPLDTAALSEAMQRLLTDAVLRAELAAKGRENRRRFSWRRCAETVMEELERVSAENRKDDTRV